MCRPLSKTLGVGTFYLINSKRLQIGIGIGKFSAINSEELQIGKFSGVNKSARERIGRQNLSQKVPSKKGSFRSHIFSKEL